MALRVILLGGPGAGKGTQGKRLSDAYEVPHISTGEIFRDIKRGTTRLALKVRPYLDRGQLVPDELAVDVATDRLRAMDCTNGYVLDGFPRTVPQAEAFDAWTQRRGQTLDAVLNLEVSDEEIVDRVLARRECPQCGAIYNLRSKPPRVSGRCDKSICRDVALVQRADDNEETIRERLNVYHEETEPLIAYYEAKGLLRRIPADGIGPDEVFEKIEEIVSALGVA